MKPHTELRFSLGFTAFQAIFFAAASALSVYMADQYLFNFAEFSATHHSRSRNAWLEEIANSDGGKVGAIIFAAVALLSAWYFGEAIWRFFSGGKAALLTERGLILHPTYRRRGEIPYAEVLSATFGEESTSGWLFKRHRLLIAFANRRDVRLRSVTTEGGKEALKAFAKELNARRRSESAAEA